MVEGKCSRQELQLAWEIEGMNEMLGMSPPPHFWEAIPDIPALHSVPQQIQRSWAYPIVCCGLMNTYFLLPECLFWGVSLMQKNSDDKKK